MPRFPVYLPYVLHLERYVEVEAETMEEAQALVAQMVRAGEIPRPRYTESLDDWTEVAGLPTAKSGFLIEGDLI
jgi:hypothetical protein